MIEVHFTRGFAQVMPSELDNMSICCTYLAGSRQGSQLLKPRLKLRPFNPIQFSRVLLSLLTQNHWKLQILNTGKVMHPLARHRERH